MDYAQVISLILFVLGSSKAQENVMHSAAEDLSFHKIQRNLLQADLATDVIMDDDDSNEEEEKEETTKEPIIYKGIVENGEPEKGPKLFYDGTKFLMRVSSPIRVHIFSNQEGGSTIGVDLDGPADSIKGSMLTEDSYKVNIDWKSQEFGNNMKIRGISIHMEFIRSQNDFLVNKLEVAGLRIDAKQMINIPLETTSTNGFKITAPAESSFCCYDLGMFKPMEEGNDDNEYKVGLSFPNLQLQVDDWDEEPDMPIRFGAEWDCDSFMTIGVWVGLLVSLFFAFVCFWGFSMLANIQTMDRFDDARSTKSIHVPTSD